jgi:hypothetical protein
MLLAFGRVGARRGVTIAVVDVNGEPGLVAHEDGRLMAVWAFECSGGAVHAIRGVVNPDKLRHLDG